MPSAARHSSFRILLIKCADVCQVDACQAGQAQYGSVERDGALLAVAASSIMAHSVMPV